MAAPTIIDNVLASALVCLVVFYCCITDAVQVVSIFLVTITIAFMANDIQPDTHSSFFLSVMHSLVHSLIHVLTHPYTTHRLAGQESLARHHCNHW